MKDSSWYIKPKYRSLTCSPAVRCPHFTMIKGIWWMLNYWDKFQLWNIRAHNWSNWKGEAPSCFSWNSFVIKAAGQRHSRQQRTYSMSGMWKKVCGNQPCSQFRIGHQFGKAKVDFLSFPNYGLLRASFFTEIFTEKLGSNSLCLDLKKRWFYGNQIPTFWFRIRRLHNTPSRLLDCNILTITADWGYSSLSSILISWVLVLVHILGSRLSHLKAVFRSDLGIG